MTRCAMLPLLVAALFSLPAASNAGPLDDVERMTATFLSQSDAGSLAYDEPQWRAAVERHLAVVPDSALRSWRPAGLVRVESATSDAVAWCATWTREGADRLVWMAAATVAGRREVMAFADVVPAADSVLRIAPVSADGLGGIGVTTADGREAFSVADVTARMALRVMTSPSRPDAEKDKAAEALSARLSGARQTLVGNLEGFPELVVCDSPDRALRTVTYMISYRDFSCRFGGWIAYRGKRQLFLEPLTDATPRIGQPEMAVLNPRSWYGALYTGIIQFRSNRKDCYALIGFKGADATTKTRVIDVVSGGEDGKFVFGATKAFLHPKQAYRRRVFRYSLQASMTMRYDERSEMIVMDHLEPSGRLMVGRPEYYGPDLSYDAYLLTNDGWKFQSDIQVTEEKGAQPNKEEEETLEGQYPATLGGAGRAGSATRSASGKGKWSGRSSESRGGRPSRGGGSWLDKGKGNSAPNVRRR